MASLEEIFDDGGTVTVETLFAVKLIDDPKKLVKILGNGELKKKLTVVATKYTASAKEKIEAAGGTATEG